MTLDEILAKLPPEFKPFAMTYGPALLKMGQDEIISWIGLIARGQTAEAYRQILANMPTADLLNEWTVLNNEWENANRAEAAKRALVQEATVAILKVLLSIALVAVGL